MLQTLMKTKFYTKKKIGRLVFNMTYHKLSKNLFSIKLTYINFREKCVHKFNIFHTIMLLFYSLWCYYSDRYLYLTYVLFVMFVKMAGLI